MHLKKLTMRKAANIMSLKGLLSIFLLFACLGRLWAFVEGGPTSPNFNHSTLTTYFDSKVTKGLLRRLGLKTHLSLSVRLTL